VKVFRAPDHSSVGTTPSAPMHAHQAEFLHDPDLLARCRAGEAGAWRQLYDAHFAFIYGVVRRLGTPAEECEDVCQEAFVVAFRRLGSFREGEVRNWLYRIAANVASERHRKRRVRRTFQELWGKRDEPEPSRTPEHDVEAREAERTVGRALEGMAAKKREVFVLFELEGLSGDEIAARLGCKVETVWSRLHYARKEFERAVKRQGA
jgi:RNA polymerase sigma-70 factor (ECF subfamily)